MRLGRPGVRLAGMTDAPIHAGADAGPADPHPLDAVLEALRAVPDSVLRDLEPATLYVPPPNAPRASTEDGR